jgi:hypothetical protein
VVYFLWGDQALYEIKVDFRSFLACVEEPIQVDYDDDTQNRRKQVARVFRESLDYFSISEEDYFTLVDRSPIREFDYLAGVIANRPAEELLQEIGRH